MADLMSSSAYLDKSHCYNSHAAAAAVYSQSYGSPSAAAHCYYGNMDYLSTSGNSHHSLSVRKPGVFFQFLEFFPLYLNLSFKLT